VVLRADATAVRMGSAELLTGAQAVAERFSGQARAARPALIDGVPGLVWSQGGTPRVVFTFTFNGDQVTAINILSDPNTLKALDVHLT
jgi:RNA polymerase sigma-70 factor (ECF subfamily)